MSPDEELLEKLKQKNPDAEPLPERAPVPDHELDGEPEKAELGGGSL